MRALKIMLKVCHREKLKYISIPAKASLSKLLRKIRRKFKVSNKYNLDLRTDYGATFTEEFYREFVDTFPASNRILHLEANIPKEVQSDPIQHIENPRKRKREDDETSNTESEYTPPRFTEADIAKRTKDMWAAPLMRQNCFIGKMPEGKCSYSKRFATYRSTRIFSVKSK